MVLINFTTRASQRGDIGYKQNPKLEKGIPALSERKTSLLQETIDFLGMKIDGQGIELQSICRYCSGTFSDTK